MMIWMHYVRPTNNIHIEYSCETYWPNFEFPFIKWTKKNQFNPIYDTKRMLYLPSLVAMLWKWNQWCYMDVQFLASHFKWYPKNKGDNKQSCTFIPFSIAFHYPGDTQSQNIIILNNNNNILKIRIIIIIWKQVN